MSTDISGPDRDRALPGIRSIFADRRNPQFDLASGFPAELGFVRAERHGDDIVYYGRYGEIVIKHRPTARSASRSWANNNPGNIEYGAFAIRNGAIGTDGRYAVFPDEDTGHRARERLLQSAGYRNLTLEQAIRRYAPPSENNTEAYIRAVVRDTGIGRNTFMRDLTPRQLAALSRAMTRQEGWKEGRILVARGNGTTPSETRRPPRPAPREHRAPDAPPAQAPLRSAFGHERRSAFDEAVASVMGRSNAVSMKNGDVIKYGISQRANPGVDVARLTRDQAIAVYRERYWNRIRNIDSLSRGAQLAAFDAAYCHGAAYANRLVRDSGGDAEKMIARRLRDYEGETPDTARGRDRLARWQERMARLAERIGGGPETAVAHGSPPAARPAPA